MANTPSFNWETPDDTDLVKDGALAIRTLGNAIDASMTDLKGGTTGQVLSKTSNTDMDFTWVTSDDADAIQNAIVDAKGDLITATAADTPARLAVGTNGQVLTADSTTATGLKWATASGASYTWTSYTPTWTNLTVGNGTVVARYLQVDKLMTVYVKLTFGSTTSISGAVVQFTVPSATTSNWQYTPIFLYQVGDYGNNSYVGTAYFEGSNTNVGLYIPKADGTYLSTSTTAITSTVPMTWTTNDTIGITFTYEVA